MKAELNQFPFVTVADQAAAPAAAPAGTARVYRRASDGALGVLAPDGTEKVLLFDGGVSLSVDDLTDADTSTAAPETGDDLRWNGTNWTPGAPRTILLEVGQTVAAYETANGVTVAAGTLVFQKA